MSAWDRFLERLPMRMRPTMREGDAGVAMRSLCVEIDELRAQNVALLEEIARLRERLLEGTEDGEVPS